MTKFVSDYAGVYGGELSSAEGEELGKFASALLLAKTKNDSAAIQSLIKQAVSEIDNEDDFEALLGVLDWIEKEAQIAPPSRSNTLGNVLAAIGAAGALAGPVAKGVQLMRRQNQLTASMTQILQDYPSLKNDPNTPRYFRLLKDFAPDIAANPLVAGNVMNSFSRLGPASITPQVINELLGLQGRSAQNLSDSISSIAQPASRAAEIVLNRAQTTEKHRYDQQMNEYTLRRKQELDDASYAAREEAKSKRKNRAP